MGGTTENCIAVFTVVVSTVNRVMDETCLSVGKVLGRYPPFPTKILFLTLYHFSREFTLT